MKKIFLFLLCSLLFTGCAVRETTTTIPFQPTTITATASISVTTPTSKPTSLPMNITDLPMETGMILSLFDGKTMDVTAQQPIFSLFRLSENGELFLLYTPSTRNADDFDVSPDGEWLVFSQQNDLYRIRTDGSDIQRLTNTPETKGRPTWSPDGKYIVFLTKFGQDWEITRMDFEGNNITRLAETRNILGLRWSLDSKWILYSSYQDGNLGIYRIATDDSRQETLAQNPGLDVGSSWSPDGKHFAFLSKSEGRSALFFYDLQSGELTRVGDNFSQMTTTDWSPDGRYLVYNGFTKDSANPMGLVFWDTKTRQIVSLTKNIPHQTSDFLAWSPDGRQVFAQALINGASLTPYLIDVETQTARKLEGLPFELNIGKVYWGKLTPMHMPLPPVATGVALADAVLPSEVPAGTPGVEILQIRANGIVKVRTGPGTFYPLVGETQKNMILEAIGRTAGRDWLQVRFPVVPNGLAWIYSSLTNYDPNENILPIINNFPPIPTPGA